MKKNWITQIKQNLGPKKVIEWKGDKLYAKWKSYYNSFNGWTGKKDTVI